MPDTLHYEWTYPTDQADNETWGAILNALFVQIDADLFTQLGFKAPKASPAFAGDATFAGTLKKLSKGHVLYYDASANGSGKITVSESSPSGTPAAGDLWLQVGSGTGWKEATVYVGRT